MKVWKLGIMVRPKDDSSMTKNRGNGAWRRLTAVSLSVLALTVGGTMAVQSVAYADEPDCAVASPGFEPTADHYLTGQVCAPSGFPYEPNIIDTDSGIRAVDPHTDGCSHVPEKMWHYNRWNACATHDYGYDLIRFGALENDNRVNEIFLIDMMADCQDRRLGAQQACESSAGQYLIGVEQRGNPQRGQRIDTSS